MKSEFQKILELKLQKESSLQQETSRSSFDIKLNSKFSHATSDLLLDIEKKFFFSQNTPAYQKPAPTVKIEKTEADYLKMKQEWIADLVDEHHKTAIEFFYNLGSRAFLTRRSRDLKRDFRKLALVYHPDRSSFQHKYSSVECEDIFKKLLQHYQKLNFS